MIHEFKLPAQNSSKYENRLLTQTLHSCPRNIVVVILSLSRAKIKHKQAPDNFQNSILKLQSFLLMAELDQDSFKDNPE